MELTIDDANCFGEAKEDDLDDFEVANNLLLPDDYRDFILEYNGGKPTPSRLPKIDTEIDWIYGFHDGPDWASIFAALDIYHGRLPSYYMPVAYDSAGNLIVMSLHKSNYGLIAFWDHENEAEEDADQYFDNMEIIADSFLEFLEMLKK